MITVALKNGKSYTYKAFNYHLYMRVLGSALMIESITVAIPNITSKSWQITRQDVLDAYTDEQVSAWM